jgi:DNA-directed RNA polymerase subunit D
MKITTLKKTKEKIILLVEGTEPAYINTLRRCIISEVPTMAIEDVEFRQNDSFMYDEMIALRLGLIPLKTDLKSYELPNECSCKGAGCAKCQLKLILKEEGPKMIFASDLKSSDPKVVPVFPEILIVKLLDHQKLEFEATAILGKGKVHMKWAPGIASFRGIPIITAGKNADKEIIKRNSKVLSITGSKVKILNHLKYNTSIEQELEENGFDIDYSEEDYVFTVESWGQLKVQEIFQKAIEEYNKQLKDFQKSIKQLTK